MSDNQLRIVCIVIVTILSAVTAWLTGYGMPVFMGISGPFTLITLGFMWADS